MKADSGGTRVRTNRLSYCSSDRWGHPMIARAIGVVVNGCGLLAGFCIAAIVTIMAFEVFCRYILNSPTYWALEISVYLLVATVSLGGPYTLRIGGHVAVELIQNMLPLGGRRNTDRLNALIVCAFGAILFWYGLGVVSHAWRLGVFSLTPLAMPLVYPLSFIPLCGLLLLIQALEILINPELQRSLAQDDEQSLITE